jgi:N-methylhydantoinase A
LDGRADFRGSPAFEFVGEFCQLVNSLSTDFKYELGALRGGRRPRRFPRQAFRKRPTGDLARSRRGSMERRVAPIFGPTGVNRGEVICRELKATVYRGYDPRDFVIVAYGGAGPVHAYSYGADLGVQKIIIPQTASVLSAHGILISDIVVTREQGVSLVCPAGTDAFGEHISADEISRGYALLERQAFEAQERQGLTRDRVRFERYADIRFRPQIYDISVEVASRQLDTKGVDELIEHFIKSYETRFGSGSAFRAAGIEITSLRVVARGLMDKKIESATDQGRSSTELTSKHKRKIYTRDGWVTAPIFREVDLISGMTVSGSSIFELADTTVVVGSGQHASVDSHLNIIIEN